MPFFDFLAGWGAAAVDFFAVVVFRTESSDWSTALGLTCLVTVETPSTNLVRKTTLALLNMPSLSDTMINCECLK